MCPSLPFTHYTIALTVIINTEAYLLGYFNCFNICSLLYLSLLSLYDCLHVNVQKSVSYHKHKNYVVTTKSVLMRMIVMKIRYFHGHTRILIERMRHQNLYILYGDTFMKQAKLLYYVFEFKCSKVLRIKKPALGPCLSYKILRISMLRSW